jgi:hypothetical protein
MAPRQRRRCQLASKAGAIVLLGSLLCAQPAAAEDLPDPWTFKVTPYGWFVFVSGQQTVRGHSVDIDTNTAQMFANSQSLIPFMGYFEARWL